MTTTTHPLRKGDLLTIKQAQRLVPVGKTTLYALVESGQFPHCRVRAAGSRRGHNLIHPADREALIDKSCAGGAA